MVGAHDAPARAKWRTAEIIGFAARLASCAHRERAPQGAGSRAARGWWRRTAGDRLRIRVHWGVRRGVDEQREQPGFRRARHQSAEQCHADVRERDDGPPSRVGRHGVEGSRHRSLRGCAVSIFFRWRRCGANRNVGHRRSPAGSMERAGYLVDGRTRGPADANERG